MITKTEFLEYVDASRHFWAIKHSEFKAKLTAFDKHIINQGYIVEEKAVKYAKQYLLPKYSSKREDLKIQQTVSNKDFQTRTDILIRNEQTNKWDLYEVKSVTKPKTENYYDVTFQKLVIEQKYDLENVFILHVNNEYVLQEEFELFHFLKATKVNKKIEKLEEEVQKMMEDCIQLANLDNYKLTEPCYKPKDCPCINLCHPNLPKYPIYDLSRISKKKATNLRDEGIEMIQDIPDDFLLSTNQRTQVKVAKNNKPLINKQKIKKELDNLEFPLYFLDYETFNPAIPMYKKYKPFQQMVFQYSLHILRAPDLEPKHKECLIKNKKEPAIQVIEHLKEDIGHEGSIIVWYKPFEATRNSEMGELYPAHQKFMENLNGRIYDLMDIVNKNYYVHPKFKGSNSIKDVLPVIAPKLSYKNLEIQNGASAMLSWYKMLYEETNHIKKEQIYSNLLTY